MGLLFIIMKKKCTSILAIFYYLFTSCSNYDNVKTGMKEDYRREKFENEIDNDNLEQENGIPGFNFNDSSLKNVASFLVEENSGYNKNYFARSYSSDNQDLFIKFKIILIDNNDMIGEVPVLGDVNESISVVLNRMFREEKYVFCVKHRLNGVKSGNNSFVKFVLDTKLVEYLCAEKKFWGRVGDNVLGKTDLYPDSPLIRRMPFGICPINPKKLMKDTHFLLFMPAIVNGSFVTFDDLHNLVGRALENIKIKNFHIDEEEEEKNKDLYTELTLEDLNSNSKRNSDSIVNVDDPILYGGNEVAGEKKGICSDELVLSRSLNHQDINHIVNDYLNDRANAWGLVYMEMASYSSIPSGYRLPNIIEAISIMLYAIENNLELILDTGIAVGEKREKLGGLYFVKYLKEYNSINICLKEASLIEKVVILKNWDNRGGDIISDTFQNAFVAPDYLCHICMCPTYCWHNGTLMKNPFCYCDWCYNYCGLKMPFDEMCVCPAIGGCCIYPNSQSCCDRFSYMSCEGNERCIALNLIIYFGTFCVSAWC